VLPTAIISRRPAFLTTPPRLQGKLYLIGIGAGNPEYITVRAIKALNMVAVFFFMDKGEAKQDLVALRKEICGRYIENRSYRVVEAEDPCPRPDHIGLHSSS
jgi:precorrin-2 methylase